MPRLHGDRDHLDVVVEVNDTLAISIDHETGDRTGQWLRAHDAYSYGDLQTLVLRQIAELVKKVRDGSMPELIPLRPGKEPKPPRNWPTAIVTKWSGKL